MRSSIGDMQQAVGSWRQNIFNVFEKSSTHYRDMHACVDKTLYLFVIDICICKIIPGGKGFERVIDHQALAVGAAEFIFPTMAAVIGGRK